MLHRRVFLAASFAALPSVAFAKPGFAGFLDRLRAEAEAQGIRPAILNAALNGIHPDPAVLKLDQKQPEFTLTWAQYRARVIPRARLRLAQANFFRNAPLMSQIVERYGADVRVVTGIWGLESAFGTRTGKFNIVQSIATLAYAGRRARFFQGELMAALHILNDGDIAPAAMTGSWAGAMGQPQFMPSAYLRYAVDADGDGRRDIWTDRADVFGSVANYLAQCGWRAGEPWGQQVLVPPGLTASEEPRRLADWEADGVRRLDGTYFSAPEVRGKLLQPDGAGGDAFLVYPNFAVIRRYNPSDFYALAVGLMGNAIG